jgi:hypothetical protein
MHNLAKELQLPRKFHGFHLTSVFLANSTSAHNPRVASVRQAGNDALTIKVKARLPGMTNFLAIDGELFSAAPSKGGSREIGRLPVPAA